jgi:hypothetical protein
VGRIGRAFRGVLCQSRTVVSEVAANYTQGAALVGSNGTTRGKNLENRKSNCPQVGVRLGRLITLSGTLPIETAVSSTSRLLFEQPPSTPRMSEHGRPATLLRTVT